MDIKEFGHIMAREVKDKLGEEYDIKLNSVTKNNGIERNALVVRKEGEAIAPTIYIDHYFDSYNEGVVLMNLVDDFLKVYRSSAPTETVDMDFYDDFSRITGHLFYKLVNYKKNKTFLEKVPYKKVMDLAMVPLCKFDHSVMRCGTITVLKEHLEMWEISEEELWENIRESAPCVEPVKISELSDVIGRLMGSDDVIEDICGMYVITNRSECLGAGAAFYPDVLKELAEDMESDLFIIPSSVHEILVVPDPDHNVDPENLKAIIHEVNVTTVSDEEILSDNLYIYDREDDRISVVK